MGNSDTLFFKQVLPRIYKVEPAYICLLYTRIEQSIDIKYLWLMSRIKL